MADLGRAALLATVSAAALADVLTIGHLVAVALLAGGAERALRRRLPGLPARDHSRQDRLIDGNGKLFATESAAHVAGPGLGGTLLQAVGAAGDRPGRRGELPGLGAHAVDDQEPGATGRAEEPQAPRADLADGLRYVFGRSFTRAILGAGVIGNFVFGGYTAIVVVFLYESLGSARGVGRAAARRRLGRRGGRRADRRVRSPAASATPG